VAVQVAVPIMISRTRAVVGGAASTPPSASPTTLSCSAPPDGDHWRPPEVDPPGAQHDQDQDQPQQRDHTDSEPDQFPGAHRNENRSANMFEWRWIRTGRRQQ